MSSTEATETPKGEQNQERPLVTFALFAYNQEKYIREAVEGAFSQTYEPLEIILSDDCSSDRTFEIMQEMAAAYEGPHEVIVRKNSQNVGVLHHVVSVAQNAKGELFILAAGDDISRPQRAERLQKAWSEGALAIVSNYSLVDADGTELEETSIPRNDAGDRLQWLSKLSFPWFIYGAASAYDIRIVKRLPKPTGRVMSEDTPLNTISQLLCTPSLIVEDVLVRYRVHENSISNSRRYKYDKKSIYEHELRQIQQSKLSSSVLSYILDEVINSLKSAGVDISSVRTQFLMDEIRFFETKSQWSSASLFFRVRSLLSLRSMRWWRWMIPRVFGVEVYSTIKSILFPWKSNPSGEWGK